MTIDEHHRAAGTELPAHRLPSPRAPADGLTGRTPDAIVVEVTGDIDLCTVPRLEATLEEHLRACPGVLRVDLGEVHFLGAAGLRALERAAEQAAEAGVHLVFDPGRSHAAIRALELLDRLQG
ncbi:STAS domain-containing protein [Amycolatopsis sp. FBCC-B4732]|uniref:STAS domain-containing protein n=1 Tax=Amycolatopsis sp. FBCC-B4732 TaxID=3079339 RepID=UPI001FF15788|nr:STAS domain-containing protein [Amycolatopsis sp. FBCC-B4732]UOX92291.1 STAS domain-containing protein [Amycolatopsis sp. FBCC-B4732]